MADFDLMRELALDGGGKILLLVMDGLGGLPRIEGGPTELEAAETPNLDRLAAQGTTGRIVPIRPGLTPGSGPAHLALFGYDPVEYLIGRGMLECIGIGMKIGPKDVAIRGNFCTVDGGGVITDRRAGRIPTEKCIELVEKLRTIKVPGYEFDVEAVQDYRFGVVIRGAGLSGEVDDTDPQQTGKKPLPAKARIPEAGKTAELMNQWIAQAGEILKDERPANMVTLRGVSMDPNLPKFAEVYKLKAACVAVYPMYKGVSQLVGMDVIETGAHDKPEDEFRRALAQFEAGYDFVFCHIKYTDSRGEDGDFDAKVKVIESVDAALPVLLQSAARPDVIAVTGDHSTPATYKSHSWHPVPLLLWAPGTHLPDRATRFGERECMGGGLGLFPASDLMPVMLAHAKRLQKFGA
ncbi:MAG: 2,3-bisphosphoglycerate-independent phosphoglycerate mutase [Anaerolineae bacterium]|nr:2,3-bisphosphoglycerate-independent phosphoglycerate mutase [Anaerolineae bacterium]